MLKELQRFKQLYQTSQDEVRKLKCERAELLDRINAEIKSKKDRLKSGNAMRLIDPNYHLIIRGEIKTLEDIKYLIEKQ